MTETTPAAPVGPFRRGFNFGFGLIVAALIFVIGLASGILAFAVSTLIYLIKTAFSKPVLLWAITTSVKAVIVYYLWPFVFMGALPLVSAFAVVILASILLAPAINVTLEKKNDGASDLALLQALLASGRQGPGAAAPGSPVRDNPATRAGSGPQRPVSAAPGR